MLDIGSAIDWSKIGRPCAGQELLVCRTCGEPLECIQPTPAGDRVFPIACRCKRESMCSFNESRAAEKRYINAYGYAWKSFAKCTFANDDCKNIELTKSARSYANSFESLKTEGSGLILFGAIDKGKTYMSACIANDIMQRGYSVIFKSVPEMVGQFQDNAFDSQSLRRALVSCDLLILDDWGSERVTEFSNEKVYDIVNARYEAHKPMIITTNHS